MASKMASRLWTAVDHFTSDMILSERDVARKKWASKPAKTSILSPDEEVRGLIKGASELRHIWEFLSKRLQVGIGLDLLCLSFLDESGDLIRVRFFYPPSGFGDPANFENGHSDNRAQEAPRRNIFSRKDDSKDTQINALSSSSGGLNRVEPMISMMEKDNHFVQAYKRKDTTFSGKLSELGEELLAELGLDAEENKTLNIFSIPLIAGNRSIALITLGFSTIDAFSQAKLSYVYTIRDQVAQLVWNLILQERMKNQSQVDSLTGLLSHTSFQRILEMELEKAESQETPMTVMIIDINNIQEINKSLGNHDGDQEICHLASTVRRLVRGLDTVARFGADE
ncbi:MAG: GGDEF domain-containing protein, partial [Cyanobacteria bacterium]|nr:GGDEF domain-containing protein [Cyanobacteriota bacterium]